MNERRKFRMILLLAMLVICSPVFASSLSETNAAAGVLRWKNNIIPIAFSSSLLKANLNIKPDSDIKGALNRSLETWENAADIKFETVWSDKQTVSPKGNFGDGVNLITIAQTPENLLLFSRSATETAAQTRVFFNKKGNITEADIVLNPYQQFSTDGSFGTFDLETTLTHEIGHLLGLRHSPIWGDAMHADKARNGTYNLNSFDGRVLGSSDISNVRGLYGKLPADENCCGKITGGISADNVSSVENLTVWAEDADGGRVAGYTQTNSKGNFEFNGLSGGRYKIFCQNNPESGGSLNAEELGTVELKKDKPASITKKITIDNSPENLRLLGFNGQLAGMSIPLNAGKSYTLYLGGQHLEPSKIKILFNNPYFKLIGGSLVSQDFGTDLSVVSVTVEVSENTPAGEYSIALSTGRNNLEFIPGAIKITDMINPWHNYNLSGD